MYIKELQEAEFFTLYMMIVLVTLITMVITQNMHWYNDT